MKPSIISWISTSALLLGSLSACSGTAPSDGDVAEGDDPSADLTGETPVAASAPRVDEPGEGEELLARVEITETHHVTFLQHEGGHVSIVETADMDQDEGSLLTSSLDPATAYAELYTELVDGQVDPEVLDRLEVADVARTERLAQRTARGEADLSPVSAAAGAPVMEAFGTEAGLTAKASQSDITFWIGECTRREREATGEDRKLCWTNSFNAGPVTVTWSPIDHEFANVELGNANFNESAFFSVAGKDCFVGSLCDINPARTKTVAPRGIAVITQPSDDGFHTFAQGNDFGLHYLFWD